MHSAHCWNQLQFSTVFTPGIISFASEKTADQACHTFFLFTAGRDTFIVLQFMLFHLLYSCQSCRMLTNATRMKSVWFRAGCYVCANNLFYAILCGNQVALTQNAAYAFITDPEMFFCLWGLSRTFYFFHIPLKFVVDDCQVSYFFLFHFRGYHASDAIHNDLLDRILGNGSIKTRSACTNIVCAVHCTVHQYRALCVAVV